VVTWYGPRHAGRMSSSILTCLGLDDWIARSRQEYVRRAAEASEDLEGLGALRRDMRRRMLASPLCNGRQFTAGLEAAYRRMWRRWCASPEAGSR
jgi:predicted O-linked N-acetylglucosamine transferase (SPINDLY family)